LEEEEFLEGLEFIIQRDFFPDIPKLKLTMDWNEAVHNQDFPKLREIQQRFAIQKSNSDSLELETPNFEETPLPENPLKKRRQEKETSIIPLEKPDDKTNLEKLSLDAYLYHYTSEDNNSFSQQMQKESEKRKQKFWWMNEVTEQQKLIEASQERLAVTWPHKPSTQLLTYPEMIPDNSLENGLREINSSGTRFKIPQAPAMNNNNQEKPKPEEGFKIISNEEFTLGAKRRAEARRKIDLENLLGEETTAVKKLLESPKVNGYGFVLDCPTPTPSDDGSGFKVPQTPKRDQIGLDLVEKVKARQRQSYTKGTTSSSLANDRTPRSQRIAEKIIKRTQKGVDMQLRASYNSPWIRTPANGPATPTPKPTPLRTPLSTSTTDK